ncbi:hypothetical protein [Pseudovibrio sp. Ad37]|uniref:hypothetical protein n=1 Tax=Pseudovibrio sp. Ad37 TaxID=989422 RepID=UPI0007AE6FB5|nr:hypothetical protein [Pseudovibrio sp. Ad37]KZL28221.1 hypothetical protein PsAD37_00998 [Pseudovibrio sp. Ad37]
MTVKRKWWIALLLQFYFASGYIYVGRLKRLALYVAFLILSITMICLPPLRFIDFQTQATLLSVLQALLSIFFTVDAARIAYFEEEVEVKSYNRWWVYLLYWLLVIAIIGPLLFVSAPYINPDFFQSIELPRLSIGALISRAF